MNLSLGTLQAGVRVRIRRPIVDRDDRMLDGPQGLEPGLSAKRARIVAFTPSTCRPALTPVTPKFTAEILEPDTVSKAIRAPKRTSLQPSVRAGYSSRDPCYEDVGGGTLGLSDLSQGGLLCQEGRSLPQ